VWNGFFVPSGTPKPIIDTLNRELVRTFNAPDVREQVASVGSQIVGWPPRRVRRIHSHRNRKVGQGDARRRREAAMTTTRHQGLRCEMANGFRIKSGMTGLRHPGPDSESRNDGLRHPGPCA
jgi:hypothetical protein